jgi:hypothetical protein
VGLCATASGVHGGGGRGVLPGATWWQVSQAVTRSFRGEDTMELEEGKRMI